MHPRILQELHEVVHIPISIIINNSIQKGELPYDWKRAHISAIFKKGAKHSAENYRPISLTSIVVKVAETMIRQEILAHMKMYKLFSNRQFGFLGGRSTVLQMLIVIDKWMEILDNGEVIDTIYCDFMKAFDKVPHNRLLKIIDRYGISGNIHTWITNYLLGRQQRVKAKDSFSDYQGVTSEI